MSAQPILFFFYVIVYSCNFVVFFLSLVNQAQQFMCFCFVNKQQVLVECGQSKNVLAVSGEISSL